MKDKKNISILGCGWLGLPLAEAFIESGFRVKGSTTREERLSVIEAAGAEGYVLKAYGGYWTGERLNDFLQCDILLIAIPPGTKRNANSTHALEIARLMEHIKTYSSAIKQVIYISSTSVYKNINAVVIESDTATPSNIDNQILFQAEKHVHESVIAEKLILRLGGLTGYDRMLGRFFAGKQELAGGNEPVNLVHRDDVVACILFLLKKGIGEQVFNICSPQHPSRKDFYTRLCDRFNLPEPHFSEVLKTDWKEVSTEKINQSGYKWLFPDPNDYTYTKS